MAGYSKINSFSHIFLHKNVKPKFHGALPYRLFVKLEQNRREDFKLNQFRFIKDDGAEIKLIDKFNEIIESV